MTYWRAFFEGFFVTMGVAAIGFVIGWLAYLVTHWPEQP